MQHRFMRNYIREETDRGVSGSAREVDTPRPALARHNINRNKLQRVLESVGSIRHSPLPCMVAAPSLP
jgi:hypothetical protein